LLHLLTAAFGTNATSRDVCFSAALGAQADLTRMSGNRRE
jgi:hypothetical protein